MAKIPMINPSIANPRPTWIEYKDYAEYADHGFVRAELFYRQKEAEYATLRREIEKKLVEQTVNEL